KLVVEAQTNLNHGSKIILQVFPIVTYTIQHLLMSEIKLKTKRKNSLLIKDQSQEKKREREAERDLQGKRRHSLYAQLYPLAKKKRRNELQEKEEEEKEKERRRRRRRRRRERERERERPSRVTLSPSITYFGVLNSGTIISAIYNLLNTLNIVVSYCCVSEHLDSTKEKDSLKIMILGSLDKLHIVQKCLERIKTNSLEEIVATGKPQRKDQIEKTVGLITNPAPLLQCPMLSVPDAAKKIGQIQCSVLNIKSISHLVNLSSPVSKSDKEFVGKVVTKTCEYLDENSQNDSKTFDILEFITFIESFVSSQTVLCLGLNSTSPNVFSGYVMKALRRFINMSKGIVSVLVSTMANHSSIERSMITVPTSPGGIDDKKRKPNSKIIPMFNKFLSIPSISSIIHEIECWKLVSFRCGRICRTIESIWEHFHSFPKLMKDSSALPEINSTFSFQLSYADLGHILEFAPTCTLEELFKMFETGVFTLQQQRLSANHDKHPKLGAKSSTSSEANDFISFIFDNLERTIKLSFSSSSKKSLVNIPIDFQPTFKRCQILLKLITQSLFQDPESSGVKYSEMWKHKFVKKSILILNSIFIKSDNTVFASRKNKDENPSIFKASMAKYSTFINSVFIPSTSQVFLHVFSPSLPLSQQEDLNFIGSMIFVVLLSKCANILLRTMTERGMRLHEIEKLRKSPIKELEIECKRFLGVEGCVKIEELIRMKSLKPPENPIYRFCIHSINLSSLSPCFFSFFAIISTGRP
ncbi:hypothetical protein ADUPG1_000126, partial [Aduncisulcus paluster]